MKLIDLHPSIEPLGGYEELHFDAPNCVHEEKCRIRIPIPPHPRAWQIDGRDFTTITVSPSIWFNRGNSNPSACDRHFFIRNGEIQFA